MMEERWFDEDISARRYSRLRRPVERLEVGFGESIALACQGWAGTKAAYRFFSNERVSEEEILRGHFDATYRRFAASDGPVLAPPRHDGVLLAAPSPGGRGLPHSLSARRARSSSDGYPRSPGSAAISPAPRTRRRETLSCGAGSPV